MSIRNICVKRSTVNNLDDKYYKCGSSPRGVALIINYKDFYDTSQFNTRKGSEQDVCNLDTVLSKVGYRVICHINLSEDLTDLNLDKLSKDPFLSKVDSFLVFIMSHGVGKTTFFTSDGGSYDVNRVRQKFTNTNCPNLKGKPKIFFFVFCRGVKDEIIESDCAVGEAPKDMKSFYSTVEGFRSKRSTLYGTPFICCICKVLATESHEKDLDDVQRSIQQKMNNYFQKTIYVEDHYFNKKFYFNPIGCDCNNCLI